MTLLYKLTTQDYKTRRGFRNECVWGPGVTHSGTGKGSLCGPGYIHAYTDPLLAVLLNPIHAKITDPVLWECEGDVTKTDLGLKVGCVTLTTVRTIPLPEVTMRHRVRFALLCAGAPVEVAERVAETVEDAKAEMVTKWNARVATRTAETAAAVIRAGVRPIDIAGLARQACEV